MKSVFTFISSRCLFRLDDDFVDRLSRQLTVTILIVFGCICGVEQYLGTPIECWFPASFTESQCAYGNSICWSSGTHYSPITEVIPGENTYLANDYSTSKLSYFKWVPFIFILQAGILFLPCLFWQLTNRLSGINVAGIMDNARHTVQEHNPEIKSSTTSRIVYQLDRYLQSQTDYRTICCCLGGRLYGNYLVSVYITTKVLYILVLVVQLLLLDTLIFDSHFYGIRLLHSLVQGQELQLLEKLPLVQICEFEFRQQSRVHKFAVQCALPVNLLNEKLFTFVWFWLVFLALAMIVSSGCWLFVALFGPGDVRYVREQLRLTDVKETRISQFTKGYLHRDGMFILRLIGMNVDEGVASEIVGRLWNSYYNVQPGMNTCKTEANVLPVGEISAVGQPLEVI